MFHHAGVKRRNPEGIRSDVKSDAEIIGGGGKEELRVGPILVKDVNTSVIEIDRVIRNTVAGPIPKGCHRNRV